jgi:hypothetical protein
MTRTEKAKFFASIYAAIAEGKTLQCRRGPEWADVSDLADGPNFGTSPDLWRIKPEPRRMWTCVSPDKQASHNTEDKDIAIGLMASHYTVTEWVEVV